MGAHEFLVNQGIDMFIDIQIENVPFLSIVVDKKVLGYGKIKPLTKFIIIYMGVNNFYKKGVCIEVYMFS